MFENFLILIFILNKLVNTRVVPIEINYNCVIKQTKPPSNSIVRLWEKFYVYAFGVLNGYKSPLNLKIT